MYEDLQRMEIDEWTDFSWGYTRMPGSRPRAPDAHDQQVEQGEPQLQQSQPITKE